MNTSLTAVETEIRPSLRPLEEAAGTLEIIDQTTYNHACEIARRAVDARRAITERLGPGKQAAHKAWKEWVSLETELLATVETAERITKQKILAWDQEQERVRQEEQRRLDEVARKLAEDQKLQSAIAAEQAGAASEEVEAILSETEMMAPVYAPPTYERVSGVSRPRDNWKAEVINMSLLIKFVAAHPEFTNLLIPNAPAINALARAQKSLLNVPGVRVFNDQNIAIRRSI